MFFYVDHISNLQGIEYFPNLYEIQLSELKLTPEMTEVVITNPNLEIVELTFYGNVENVYLTDCEKLRVCIVNRLEEPGAKVHLPEQLEWQTVEGWDCVIGETPRAWFGGEIYPAPEPTDIPWEPEEAVDVVLEETSFPDPDFREFLALYVDADGNGILEQKERNQLRSLACYGPLFAEEERYSSEELKEIHNKIKTIRSFEGIAYFEQLGSVDLNYESMVEILPLHNPNLEDVKVSTETIREFSLQSASALKSLEILVRKDRPAGFHSAIDWGSLCKLENLDVQYVNVDMDALMQNEKLEEIAVSHCDIIWQQKEVNFAALTKLTSFELTAPEYIAEHWGKVLDFGANGKLIYVQVTKGVVEQLRLPSLETEFGYLESEDAAEYCRVFYAEETEHRNLEEVPEGSIPLDAVHFPDGGFQNYLYHWVDWNHDKLLSTEEREALTSLRNCRVVTEDTAEDMESEREDIDPDEFYEYNLAEKIGDLRGIEYFPNLSELRLVGICLSPDVKELVITNPNLEIVHLTLYGAAECIDLTACGKLRVCVLRSDMEPKPELLLPKHLELETAEGWDCVIGETAQEMYKAE